MADVPAPRRLDAPVFRRVVTLDPGHGAVASAVLHVSSLGVHECFLDGAPEPLTHGRRCVAGFDAAGGRIAIAEAAVDHPAEIVTLDGPVSRRMARWRAHPSLEAARRALILSWERPMAGPTQPMAMPFPVSR